MRVPQVLITILILATGWHTAAAQPKKKSSPGNAPPIESILAGTRMRSGPVLSDLTALKSEMPLGPQDVLKSYEIAMGMLTDKTSADFSVIVQAQQTNQITREQAEYLLQQRYQVTMMQYQVLGALHDVLQHDIDEASQQGTRSLKGSRSNTILAGPASGASRHTDESKLQLREVR